VLAKRNVVILVLVLIREINVFIVIVLGDHCIIGLPDVLVLVNRKVNMRIDLLLVIFSLACICKGKLILCNLLLLLYLLRGCSFRLLSMGLCYGRLLLNYRSIDLDLLNFLNSLLLGYCARTIQRHNRVPVPFYNSLNFGLCRFGAMYRGRLSWKLGLSNSAVFL
jgi:hypothetical protein